jgi:hypothetical protein
LELRSGLESRTCRIDARLTHAQFRKEKILEEYFHLKLDYGREIQTPSFGKLPEKARSWKITFFANVHYCRPADINSRKKLLETIKLLRNDLLYKNGNQPSNLIYDLCFVWFMEVGFLPGLPPNQIHFSRSSCAPGKNLNLMKRLDLENLTIN